MRSCLVFHLVVTWSPFIRYYWATYHRHSTNIQLKSEGDPIIDCLVILHSTLRQDPVNTMVLPSHIWVGYTGQHTYTHNTLSLDAGPCKLYGPPKSHLGGVHCWTHTHTHNIILTYTLKSIWYKLFLHTIVDINHKTVKWLYTYTQHPCW